MNKPTAAIALSCWLMGLAVAPAYAQHNHGPGTSATANAAFWAGPFVSGSWYDPTRSGEGIILQHLPNGRVLALWFTFAATGEAAEQAWFIANDGVIDERTLRFTTVLQPKGGVFGDRFDPAAVVNERWGTLELEFSDCHRATLRYVGPPGYGQGTRNLQRLSTLDQLACDGSRAITPTGARAAVGLASRSGAWFVASRPGEGWVIEDLADGRSVVYWFTFDPQGRQAWTVGTGRRSGSGAGTRIDIDENLIARGTRFGEAFRAADVAATPWGRLSFAFANCGRATVSYQSVLTGYGSATREGTRLTHLTGAECVDADAPALRAMLWQELPSLPGAAQSELAATVWDDKIYALGGFGDPRAFKRYDPARNQWQVLPELPAGRDHHAAFAIDGGIYFTGGGRSVQNPGSVNVPGFRYDVARNLWEERPELPTMFGSHAAALAGRAYIGDGDGSLTEYDPLHRKSRRIARALNTPDRDHSNVVAFQGEIWMIAGRAPENASVAIYNPMSESWRVGPSIQRPRGGFAAGVVGNSVVIMGGEVISNERRLERSTEIFSSGATSWVTGPQSPIPTHGVGGASVGNTFYAVSGSTLAGSVGGATGRLFALRFE